VEREERVARQRVSIERREEGQKADRKRRGRRDDLKEKKTHLVRVGTGNERFRLSLDEVGDVAASTGDGVRLEVGGLRR
jgi:hypothetical protein